MRRRGIATATALGAAALSGCIATIALWEGNATSASPAPAPVATATVVRTDLVSTVLTEGTLGYAPADPVVNRLSGTYTELPSPGTVVSDGGTLYRVDNTAVVLMTGSVPAWRPFQSGMTDGPDVTELESDLIALGFARGLFSEPGDHFVAATAAAVERWQRAVGDLPNGTIALGQIEFLPAPVLVGAQQVLPGQSAAPGEVSYLVTTTARVVSVGLNPDLPAVSVGEPVSIVLPSNATTPGRVTAVGPPPPNGSAGSQTSSSSGSANASGSGQPPATAVATVVPERPEETGNASGEAVQVELTVQSAANVLAVPVSALLALAGGGYGLEVVGPHGHHHLVGVTTGVFSNSQVQVSGEYISPGTKVVVAE